MQSTHETSRAESPKLPKSLKERILREIALIGGLVLAGLVLLPILIYLVGRTVFGEYGGEGFYGFYMRLHQDLSAGEAAAIFLLLSPCLLWLLLRLTAWLFRRMGRQPAGAP